MKNKSNSLRPHNIELISAIIGSIIVFLPAILNCYICGFTYNNPNVVAALIGFGCSTISAAFVLYIQRISKQIALKKYYKNMEGVYTRIDMGQDNQDDSEWMKTENLGLEIIVTYIGDNNFELSTNYWKANNAQAIGMLEFSESNKSIANGRYQYTKGGPIYEGSFGTYLVHRLGNEDKLYVLYQHIFPRKNENNPDNNKGWEVWQKQ